MIAQFIRDLSNEIAPSRTPAPPPSPADLVAAARASWEKYDRVYWDNRDEMRQTTTTGEFQSFVERCRLRAAAAHCDLEEAEIVAGVRWFPSPAGSVYPAP
jgi:hypothetical protein